MNTGKYHNPRIDRGDSTDQACHGNVELDTVKSTWVIVMLLLGTLGSALTISLSAVILFVLFTGFTLCFGHSLGMHRRFIHRSYRCPKWLEVFMVHLGTIVGLAGPMGMLRTHDTRDWAQRQTQCHDYFSHGSVWYKDLYWQIFCSFKADNTIPFTPEPEIENDQIYQWMEANWMLQQLPWAILFFSIGGWSWVCWGIGSRVSVSILGHWLIGYFAHNAGHRDWHVQDAAVQGHNVPWMALLTMGESWHNNHHAFPNSAKLGLEPGQWDPGWWVLKLMQYCGLVSHIVTPKELLKRPELVRL